MGIKGLPGLIEKKAGSAAIKDYDVKRFRNMRIAVDAPLLMYQTVIAIRHSKGEDFKNESGQLTSHLYGIFYKIINMISAGIIPIFVFDGRSPDLKNKTLHERRERKIKAEESAKKSLEENNITEYIKHFKKTFTPTSSDYREYKRMLELMGIPYIDAPGEAEAVCAWLAARYDENGKRYVKGVCTEDSDVLALGSPYMFKNMSSLMNKKRKRNKGGSDIRVISLNKARKAMGLTQEQFIDLCILLGCDYCDTIPKLGPIRSYEWLIKYGSLENIFQHYRKKYPEEVIEEECMLAAKKYFNTALNDLDKNDSFKVSTESLSLKPMMHDELIDFMCKKHGFNQSKIENVINRIETDYSVLRIDKKNQISYQ